MSMSPNNPFEDPQNAHTDHGASPTKKNNSKVLIGCGIFAVLGLLFCCGGVVLLVQFGIGALGDELERQVASNPTIVEHIGDIQSFDVSWSATIEEAQKTGDQDSGLIYELEGSQGSGRLLVRQDQPGQNIDAVTLILPDGSRIPIDLGPGPQEVEELDMDFDDLIDSGDIDTGQIETGQTDTGQTDTFEIVVPEEPVETEL